MLPQEYTNNGSGRPTTLNGNFTSAEVEALTDLRRNCAEHGEYLERLLEERRLEFARWLLENGKLSEACPNV